MASNTTDVIVVGGGVMGCATAYQLAKDGARVLLLEQFKIGNHLGSSHGASRLFRLAHTSTDYLELARSALPLWRELEVESGERRMQQSDALDLGTPGMLEPLIKTLQATGVPFELLDSSEIMSRFPQFSLPEDIVSLYQSDYALLAAGRSVNAFAALARRYGANLLEGQTVLQVVPSGGGVQVRTNQGTFSAGSVVLCAGSWMGILTRQLGLDLPLTVRQEVVTFYQPADPAPWMPGRFPLFRHHLQVNYARWGVGFPIFEHTGVKMLLDCSGPFVEPGETDRTPDGKVLGWIKSYAAKMFPTLGEDIIETETCRYTMTPDEDFILDRHPEYPQVVIASPCSGHGFKFAPLIGHILADLALRGSTGYDITRFRLNRPGLKKTLKR